MEEFVKATPVTEPLKAIAVSLHPAGQALP